MRKYESMFEDEIDEKQSQIYLDLIEKTEKLQEIKFYKIDIIRSQVLNLMIIIIILKN